MSETFTLSEPIKVGGEEVTELQLRKPTVEMLGGTKIDVTGDGGISVDADTVIKVFSSVGQYPDERRQADQRRRLHADGAGLHKFFREVPGDWRDLIGELAWFYHWPPSELAKLTIEQVLFWHGQAKRIHKETQGNGQT